MHPAGTTNSVTWDLFIDESGKFDQPERVAVAGVLVSSGADCGLSGALAADLRRLLPGMPVPWHSCLFWKLSGLLLAYRIHRQQAIAWLLEDPVRGIRDAIRTGDSNVVLAALLEAEAELEGLFDCHLKSPERLAAELLRRDLDAAGEFYWWETLALGEDLGGDREPGLDDLAMALERALPDECRGAMLALRGGAEPKVDWLRAMDDWLELHAPKNVLASLRDWQGEVGAVFRRVVKSRVGDAVRPQVCLFVAGEGRLQDWQPPNEPDRYVSLLHCLLCRVSETVGLISPPGSSVRVHVLSRDVVLRGGDGRPRELDLSAVKDLVRAVEFDVPRGARMEASEVRRYLPGLDSRYVLADFSAFAVRRRLRGNIRRVEPEIQTFLGTPLRSGTPGRSHLIAAGWTWANRRSSRTLADVLNGLVSPPGGPLHRWAVEAAWEWV